MGLVFPSHILASVFISLQFSFHPHSKTNKNNPATPRISSECFCMVGSHGQVGRQPEVPRGKTAARGSVPPAEGPPHMERRGGPLLDGPGEDMQALPLQASWLVLSALLGGPRGLLRGLGKKMRGGGQMSCGHQGATRPAATCPGDGGSQPPRHSRGLGCGHRGALGSGVLPCTGGALRSWAQHHAGEPPWDEAATPCSRKTGLCWEGLQSISV